MGIELNAELGGQLCIAGWRVQADGEHHHVKLLFLHPILGGGVPDGYITGFRVFFCYGDVAPDKPDTGKVLRPLKETLKVLAKRADVVVKYRTFGLGVVIFGQYHLFLRIGAADGRAIAVAARDDLPGADALDPGDFFGMLQVGRTQDLAFIRPRRR